MGNLFKDVLKNSSSIHKDKDGNWGTDAHDAEILKGLAEVIKVIWELIIGSKKKVRNE